jgi:hypothetical protein
MRNSRRRKMPRPKKYHTEEERKKGIIISVRK